MPQHWGISKLTYIFITFWEPKVKLFWLELLKLSPSREIYCPGATIPGCLQVVAACLGNIQVDGPHSPLLVVGRMVGQATVSRAVLVTEDQVFFMWIEAEPERENAARDAPL